MTLCSTKIPKGKEPYLNLRKIAEQKNIPYKLKQKSIIEENIDSIEYYDDTKLPPCEIK